jgi:hypothetical protein
MFRNRSLPQHLFLLTAIPTIGLAAFAVLHIFDSVERLGDAARLRHIVALDAALSDLASAITVERGAATQLLNSAAGPEGFHIAAENVDQAAAALQPLDPFGLLFRAENLRDLRDALDAELAQRNRMRDAVVARNATVGQALGYYRSLNALILALIESSGQDLSIPEAGGTLRAYVSVLRAQELASQQRTPLTGLLLSKSAKGHDRVWIQLKFAHAREQDLLQAALLVGSQADRLKAARVLAEPGFVRAAQLRDRALADPGHVHLDIAPDVWFQAQSERIQAYSKVADLYRTALDRIAAKESDAARASFYLSLASSIGVLVVTGIWRVALRRCLLATTRRAGARFFRLALFRLRKGRGLRRYY